MGVKSVASQESVFNLTVATVIMKSESSMSRSCQ